MAMDLLHRRERFIIRAIEIMDDLGMQGLSTREIARREGVSEATLFRHFKNKNGLLEAVLDYYFQFDNDIFQTTRLKELKSIDAILFFINSYMGYYENYPAITSIMDNLGVLKYEADLGDKIKRMLEERTKNLGQFILEAQQSGDLGSHIDSENLADIILSYCNGICLKWRFADMDFPLKYTALLVLGQLLTAFGNNL